MLTTTGALERKHHSRSLESHLKPENDEGLLREEDLFRLRKKYIFIFILVHPSGYL